MATVCAGTMALMDAGVQIERPVSGIAMGLISDGDRYAVLSDILGDEDHLGDMDFKVTGTSEGITACQMDIKIKGLPYEILVNALKQARAGRLHMPVIGLGLPQGCGLRAGRLADLAPTVLELMDLPKPDEMTGLSLITHP